MGLTLRSAERETTQTRHVRTSNLCVAYSWIKNKWSQAELKFEKLLPWTKLVLLTVSPTIGVTPQKECIPDAHCVVDIQIKLQITTEWRPERIINIINLLSDLMMTVPAPALLSPAFLPEPEDWHFGSDQLIPLYIRWKSKQTSWDPLSFVSFSINRNPFSTKWTAPPTDKSIILRENLTKDTNNCIFG